MNDSRKPRRPYLRWSSIPSVVKKVLVIFAAVALIGYGAFRVYAAYLLSLPIEERIMPDTSWMPDPIEDTFDDALRLRLRTFKVPGTVDNPDPPVFRIVYKDCGGLALPVSKEFNYKLIHNLFPERPWKWTDPAEIEKKWLYDGRTELHADCTWKVWKDGAWHELGTVEKP